MQGFNIHEKNPQQRLVEQVVARLAEGQIGCLPTDTGLSLICTLDNAEGKNRIQTIRDVSQEHFFTLLCSDLSHISQYARVDNDVYRLIKRCIPGEFTFILPATKEVPRRLIHPKRKTIGIRVPNQSVCQHLIKAMPDPMMSMSYPLPANTNFNDDLFSLIQPLKNQIDFYVDTETINQAESTIVDCCETPPAILRQGKGQLYGGFDS